MAQLKSIKQKEKTFIFKSYGNDESENPAKVVFTRFPLQDEFFPMANQKGLLESSVVKDFNNTLKARERLVEHVVNTMMDNLTANRVDYKRFFKECVDHFEDLIFDGKEIKTIEDFLTLPEEAAFKIALEIYLYAKQEDEFTLGE